MNENLKYQIPEIIYGDESIFQREDFEKIDFASLKKSLFYILNNNNFSSKEKEFLIKNSWKLTYQIKPPSIQEFLSEEWIGSLSTQLYPYVRDVLEKFFIKNDNHYRHLILSPFIGWGKTRCSILAILYEAVHVWCMRDANKYFKLDFSNVLAFLFVSFTQKAAKKLYRDPLMNILEACPKFQRCKTENSMRNRQAEDPNTIYFTTAGTFLMQFSRGAKFAIASDPSDLIGLTILVGTMSEISFWKDFGLSDENIWRVYIDLRDRIYSRFKGHYLGRTIIDSSPNSLDTKIDRYIWNESHKDKLNFIVRGAMWDYKTWEFENLEEKFPIFKGTASKQPKVLNESEIKNYDKTDIIFAPHKMADDSDLKDLAERDLNKFLKNYAGIPAGLDEKIIHDKSAIEDIFDDQLKNIYHGIKVPANKPPKKMIWNQIKDTFFKKLANNKYEFYRSPSELRYLAVDQSEVGDATGIAMVHPEMNELGMKVFIVDFSILIIPDKNRINLDAIYEFILDLKREGRIAFGGVYFDRFESAGTIQRLKRKDFPAEKSSVEREKTPYMTLASYILNRRVKCGKNIFFKNNLKSLVEIETKSGRKKIDHTIGEVDFYGDDKWETSTLGYNANDLSDAVCNAFFNCLKNHLIVPKYQYEKTVIPNEGKSQIIKNKLKSKIYEKYNLKTG